MNYCRICGDIKTARPRGMNRGSLCDYCAKDTPAKVSRAEFEAEYWKDENGKSNPGSVPDSIRREFYADYRGSKHELPEYIKATAGEAMA